MKDGLERVIADMMMAVRVRGGVIAGEEEKGLGGRWEGWRSDVRFI